MQALYDDILRIAREYMGLAAEDYIQRRIRIVQHGAPATAIEPEKLERLAAGIDMTAKVYMSQARVEEFKADILALKDKFNG